MPWQKGKKGNSRPATKKQLETLRKGREKSPLYQKLKDTKRKER